MNLQTSKMLKIAAGIATLAGLCFAIWHFSRAKISDLDTKTESEARIVATSGILSTHSTHSKAIQAGVAAPADWLGNTDIRQLLTSPEVAKIDYGLIRLGMLCDSYRYPTHKAIVFESTARAKAEKSADLMLGDATQAEKEAAFERSRTKCARLYGGSVPTDEELDRFRTQAAFKRWAELSKRSIASDPALTTAEISEARSTVVSAPMFGTLEATLLPRLDITSLTKKFGKEQADQLHIHLVTMVLCRMGDDCGKNGLVTDQQCWRYGLCGDNVEAAILQNLASRGFDANEVSDYASDIHTRLQYRDFSMLTSSSSPSIAPPNR